MNPGYQPTDFLKGLTPAASTMKRDEWLRMPPSVRGTDYFIESAPDSSYPEMMIALVIRGAQGEAGEFELRRDWEQFLKSKGYPNPGSLEDFSNLGSLVRFNFEYRTLKSIAFGWHNREGGLRRGPLLAFPMWELKVYGDELSSDKLCDRFVRAGGELREGRLVARKDSAVWRRFGDRNLFPDGLGIDHPPFYESSDVYWSIVGAREAIEKGLMTRSEIKQQAEEISR